MDLQKARQLQAQINDCSAFTENEKTGIDNYVRKVEELEVVRKKKKEHRESVSCVRMREVEMMIQQRENILDNLDAEGDTYLFQIFQIEHQRLINELTRLRNECDEDV